MDRLCSRDTWAREAGDTPWPRPKRSLAELSVNSLASSELQRGSGMGWRDCWRPRLGLVGRKEKQELAQAMPCLAGLIIRGSCSSLLLPFRGAKIHQTAWKEPLKTLIQLQGGLVGLESCTYICLWDAGRLALSCFPSGGVAQQL